MHCRPGMRPGGRICRGRERYLRRGPSVSIEGGHHRTSTDSGGGMTGGVNAGGAAARRGRDNLLGGLLGPSNLLEAGIGPIMPSGGLFCGGWMLRLPVLACRCSGKLEGGMVFVCGKGKGRASDGLGGKSGLLCLLEGGQDGSKWGGGERTGGSTASLFFYPFAVRRGSNGDLRRATASNFRNWGARLVPVSKTRVDGPNRRYSGLAAPAERLGDVGRIGSPVTICRGQSRARPVRQKAALCSCKGPSVSVRVQGRYVGDIQWLQGVEVGTCVRLLIEAQPRSPVVSGRPAEPSTEWIYQALGCTPREGPSGRLYRGWYGPT